MKQYWTAQRTTRFHASGIRKYFDLAAKAKDPVNLSIGQPDFDVPDLVRQGCIDAIESRKNGYSPTQGISPLLEKVRADVQVRFAQPEREVFISSGSSGGLMLAMMAVVDPGDEVIIFDPYFVIYEVLVHLVDAVPKFIPTYPTFHIDPQRLAEAITPRTKMIILNSPSNPTGTCYGREEIRRIAQLAAEHNIALLSDEVYRSFSYDGPFVSPAEFNPDTIVVDGFSKSHAMTGWRLGVVHAPRPLVETMLRIQQFTFVCAPQPVQWGGVAAMETDTQPYMEAYRRKRDRLVAGLADLYEIERPGGAFYLFPKAPWGTGTEFVTKAIERNLFVIPGAMFSRRDTHFRIAYAVDDAVLDRGIEILRDLAQNRG